MRIARQGADVTECWESERTKGREVDDSWISKTQSIVGRNSSRLWVSHLLDISPGLSWCWWFVRIFWFISFLSFFKMLYLLVSAYFPTTASMSSICQRELQLLSIYSEGVSLWFFVCVCVCVCACVWVPVHVPVSFGQYSVSQYLHLFTFGSRSVFSNSLQTVTRLAAFFAF